MGVSSIFQRHLFFRPPMLAYISDVVASRCPNSDRGWGTVIGELMQLAYPTPACLGLSLVTLNMAQKGKSSGKVLAFPA